MADLPSADAKLPLLSPRAPGPPWPCLRVGCRKFLIAMPLAFITTIMTFSFSSGILAKSPTFDSLCMLSLWLAMAIHLYLSTVPSVVAVPNASLGPLMLTMARGVAARIAAEQSGKDAEMTIVVSFALISIVSGAVQLALSEARLGASSFSAEAAGYIPFPVLRGVMTAIGLMQLVSGFELAGEVVVFESPPLGHCRVVGPPGGLQARHALLAAPTFVLGAALFAVGCVDTTLSLVRSAAKPFLLAFAIVAFYAVSWLSDVDSSSLRRLGWLGPMPDSEPFYAAFLNIGTAVAERKVAWDVVFSADGIILVLPVYIIVHLVTLLVQLPALTAVAPEVQFDKELKSSGVSSLCPGLVGGVSGYHALVSILLHKELGGDRASGAAIACLCAACWMAGPTLAASVPRFVLGGIYVYFGLSLSLSNTILARERLSKSDKALLVLTASSYISLGSAFGVLVGIVLTSLKVVFVLSQEVRSSLIEQVRSEQLSQQEVHVTIALRGVIFFATTVPLASSILAVVREKESAPGFTRGVVTLDFSHVQSMDASAIHALVQLSVALGSRGWLLTCSGMRSRLRAKCKSVGLRVQEAKGGSLPPKVAACATLPADLSRHRRQATPKHDASDGPKGWLAVIPRVSEDSHVPGAPQTACASAASPNTTNTGLSSKATTLPSRSCENLSTATPTAAMATAENTCRRGLGQHHLDNNSVDDLPAHAANVRLGPQQLDRSQQKRLPPTQATTESLPVRRQRSFTPPVQRPRPGGLPTLTEEHHQPLASGSLSGRAGAGNGRVVDEKGASCAPITSTPTMESLAQSWPGLPDLGAVGEVFCRLGTVEEVSARAVLLARSAKPLDKILFLAEGCCMLWWEGDRPGVDQRGVMKQSPTLVGCAEVLLGLPFTHKVMMLVPGRVWWLHASQLPLVKAEHPEAWELLLAHALREQANALRALAPGAGSQAAVGREDEV